MNNIFIFNNTYFDEFILNFKNNILYLTNNDSKNLYYKFEILNKNELKVYWYEYEEILYTEDSYLYFLDKEKIKIIKKVYLYHPEWNDQCIMNCDTNRISRINIKNEKGSFEYNNDKLIINWDKWNYEIFEFFDEYTFYKLDYIKNIESFKNKNYFNNINNYIFIHVCCLENWKEIFEDMIKNIKDSGLYNNVKKIFLGILGNFNNETYFTDNFLDNDNKFKILYINENIFNYEILTINCIKDFCNNDIDNEYEANILYIHTKGVRKAGNDYCTISWRKMMEYHLIENYEKCLSYLGIYDVIGSNIINTFDNDNKIVSVNGKHNYHYSGNFWWSKKSYIKNLVNIDVDLTETSILTRCKAENWICSNYPNAKLGIIFNDFTNTHPYHRYVFDYYKKIYFSVKPL
jgi:hypothetical protein